MPTSPAPPLRSSRRAESPPAPADLRRRVLDASVLLLQQEGVAALSMREVARRAGVSHQAPYHYFDDREAILAAIAEEGFRALAASMKEVNAQGVSGVEKLERCGLGYVQFALSRPAHFRVMFRPELVDVRKFPCAQEEADGSFEELRKVVRQCLVEGVAGAPDEQVVALLAWSVAHGLSCLLLDGPLSRENPHITLAPEVAVAGVMRALRGILESAAQRPSKPPPGERVGKKVAKKKAAGARR